MRLKKQCNVADLVNNGQQLEAAGLGTERITADKHENTNSYHVGHIKKPGYYFKQNCSFKKNDSETTKQIETTNKQCRTCSSKKISSLLKQMFWLSRERTL